jgi:hypothetical protein
MGKRNKRVDAYIQKSAEFAKPILTYIRESVHAACPEVEETIKWGMPSFEYKGPYFSMAAFKAHCSAGFWKANLLKDPGGAPPGERDGRRIGHGSLRPYYLVA